MNTRQNSQGSLLFDSHSISVPEIKLGPIKYEIGEIAQLLRPAEELEVSGESDVALTARITERCLHLSNGEKVLFTKRRSLKRPNDIDGVLIDNGSGPPSWLSHRLIDEAQGAQLTERSEKIALSWADKLRYRAEKQPADSPADWGLRPPQLGALHAIGAHWSLAKSPATIVMPTGTGKTETMLATLIAHRIEHLLVVVPSRALRTQIAEKFETLGKLRELGVVPDAIENPIVAIIRRRPKTEAELRIFRDCNVAVGVVSSLSGGTATSLQPAIAACFDGLIVDEAHHVAATTWNQLKEAFFKRPILQFTATPFRSDGKLVDGAVIYSYPLKAAQEGNYFKRIDFVPLYEIDLDNADRSIAEAAVARLREDIANGHPHQMMARCRSKDRAEEVHKIYAEIARDLAPILVHSDIEDNDERVARIRSGDAKIVVCVNMLGEGIDIPALKVAAIHDLHQSLAVLLQFVGRFTRKGDLNLGDASVVANIASPTISDALEQLYSEDSDWNSILREMSSEAAKEHSEFIRFLDNSEPFDVGDGDAPGISQSSLRPIFSTLFYRCTRFHPKRFIAAIGDKYELVRVWLNEGSRTLYFVTRSKERVKWSKSKEVDDTQWHLFVIHHDDALGLLVLASSNKSSDHTGLAKAVGATEQLTGEEMFRSLGKIGRLVFNNLGVTKHGRRNLSFAMYTGADVKQALSETEKKGSRKSNISGYGWENGQQITIGCSYKGRVWSKAAGTIPQFVKWAHGVGEKLIDSSIDTKSVISNVLIPEYANELSDTAVLSIEWPNELLSQSEDRVSIASAVGEFEIFNADIQCTSMDHIKRSIEFEVVGGEDRKTLGRFRMQVDGEEGYTVSLIDGIPPVLRIGTVETDLAAFFNDFPPLIRFVDLSELDGNIILRSEDAGAVEVPAERLEVWDWNETDIKKESIWKNGVQRTDSIQWKAAQSFIDGGYAVVFDDDDPGEAADLVCIKEEEEQIRLVLVHCKFSGGVDVGVRIADVVEVSSQAVRSAKWPGKFKELVKHIQNRERLRKRAGRTGYLAGSPHTMTTLLRLQRFKPVKPEVLIVQPGVSKSKLTRDQSVVLGAAAAYLKQTLGIDLDIACGI